MSSHIRIGNMRVANELLSAIVPMSFYIITTKTMAIAYSCISYIQRIPFRLVTIVWGTWKDNCFKQSTWYWLKHSTAPWCD